VSGPLDTSDDPIAAASTVETQPVVEITPGREAVVGTMTVRRVLPRRLRRTVGAWCFADHMGPHLVTERQGLDIGPHPHIGLHTVTWLLAGEVLHRDSLGSEQVIRPGQLNLMTAGHGVAHSEEGTGSYRGEVHGVQLWVAQPESTRHGAPAFEHHAELPELSLGDGRARLLVGEAGGVRSPARADTPIVGLDGALEAGASRWPLRPDFEYAVIVLSGSVAIDDKAVVPGQLAYLGEGRDDVTLLTTAPARVLLLGGEPFDEPILMWWNYVARTRAEIDAAARDWNDAAPRFGEVASPLARIPSPLPVWRHGS
jgi:redox-sensitive bicupin YhaK (pirin superfamily)